MSYVVVQFVRRHSQAKGATLAVHIVLAEHARSDGTNAHPSVARIAAETRCSRRTVQYALRTLEDAGCIRRTGLRRSGTIVYAVLMTDAAKGPVPRFADVADCAGGAQSTTSRGATSAPEPSVKGQRKVPIEVAVEGTGAGAQRTHGLHALRDASRHLSQHPALIGGGVR